MKKSSEEMQEALEALADGMFDRSKDKIKEARTQIQATLEKEGFRDGLSLIEALHDAILIGIEWTRSDEGLTTSDHWRDGR